MELQYYIQYILSWVYHNVLYTDAAFAIVRILIIIGMVSLLVYHQYILFVLLCIVVISAEYCKDGDNLFAQFAAKAVPRTSHIVDKDELTRGISIGGREGFSLTMPKIIKGDTTGKDHRRSNKFIEEDSREFTDKEFTSKQCSIGSGIGGITMFGSNELIGSRDATLRRIYDFAGNVTNNTTTDNDTNTKRLKYFKDCVIDPIKRSTTATTSGVTDFRDFKKKVYGDITTSVIDIDKCLARFNTSVLFSTSSDITGGYSTRLTSLTDNTLKVADTSFNYTSLIVGGPDNMLKLSNIQALNKGKNADNVDERTYSALLKATNNSKDVVYINKPPLKQRAIDIFGKVYGYRKRIDEILGMMRAQTKNDTALLHTVRISEPVVQELRTMLSYLAIIKQTNAIIKFEEVNGIYRDKLNITPPPMTLDVLTIKDKESISGAGNNIFKTPLDDDTYNTNDEKRYLYGITYYIESS
jgi:hypothetical protein